MAKTQRTVSLLLGGVNGEQGERQHARVELFRKQWSLLTAAKPVDVVASDVLSEIRPICERINRELAVAQD